MVNLVPIQVDVQLGLAGSDGLELEELPGDVDVLVPEEVCRHQTESEEELALPALPRTIMAVSPTNQVPEIDT